MVRACDKLAWCGALVLSVCGTAIGAITVTGGDAGAGGQVSSYLFPWSDEYYPPYGGLYVSYDGSAGRAGASAWSGVATSSTPDPGHPGEWPWVCGTFSGSGYASAGVNAPNGASATAGSHVTLSFDADYIFGISFKTTGIGHVALTGPGNVVYAECTGNNEITGFLPAGHYSLSAWVDASVAAVHYGPDTWPAGWPSSVSAAGTYSFTVPGSGSIAVFGVAGLIAVRRRRG